MLTLKNGFQSGGVWVLAWGLELTLRSLQRKAVYKIFEVERYQNIYIVLCFGASVSCVIVKSRQNVESRGILTAFRQRYH